MTTSVDGSSEDVLTCDVARMILTTVTAISDINDIIYKKTLTDSYQRPLPPAWYDGRSERLTLAP